MFKVCLCLLFVAGVFFSAPFNAIATEQYKFTSYKDIDKLFEEKGYTREHWKKDIREVFRIYLTIIPKHWQDKDVAKMSVAHKKRLFFV